MRIVDKITTEDITTMVETIDSTMAREDSIIIEMEINQIIDLIIITAIMESVDLIITIIEMVIIIIKIIDIIMMAITDITMKETIDITIIDTIMMEIIDTTIQEDHWMIKV